MHPEKMTFRIEDGDEFVHGQMEYWSQVKESEGFDVDHISGPQGTPGLLPFDCQRDDVSYTDHVLVKRYARMGLHRYNMSLGTNFQLHHLKKFNVTMNCLGTYYITLVAFDPATTSLLTFQVGVSEEAYGRLNLSCFIARPQDAPKDNLPFNPVDFGPVDRSLPCWPSDFNDIDRFYLVKESELQDNDWIRLYLELALCTNDRGISDSSLSQLQIVKVAIETNENNEPLQAKSATFYITFKGLAMARIGEIGEHIERKVIVKRVINEHTGYLTLLGAFGFSIGEETKQRPMTRRNVESSEQRPRRIRLIINQFPQSV